MIARLSAASLQEIELTPELLDFARALGRSAFADNCAPCHGTGGGGAKGYPNLVDNDWLWGGSLDQIAQTIRHGARAGDDEGRQGSMPAFGRDGMLKSDEISTVANYVRTLSGLKPSPAPTSGAAARFSPTIAPSVTGHRARAIASLARRI